MSLGEYIRTRRADLGLTQAQLGQKVGLARESISAMENNRVDLPPRETLHALARALDVEPGDLLYAAGYLLDPPGVAIEPDETLRPVMVRLRKMSERRKRHAARMLREWADSVESAGGNA